MAAYDLPSPLKEHYEFYDFSLYQPWVILAKEIVITHKIHVFLKRNLVHVSGFRTST
jgi:hypothetical protein